MATTENLANARQLLQPMAHSHAGIYVSDMARSISFYRDLLGFDLRYDSAPGQPGDRVVFGLIAGLAVELVKKAELGVTAAPVAADGMGIANLSFSVPDVDQAYAALLARNLANMDQPTTLPSGVRLVLFRDPDGNLIELLDLRGPKSVYEMMS